MRKRGLLTALLGAAAVLSTASSRAAAPAALAAAEKGIDVAEKADKAEFEQRKRRRNEAKEMSGWAKEEQTRWAPNEKSLKDLAAEQEAIDKMLDEPPSHEPRAATVKPGGLAGLQARAAATQAATNSAGSPTADSVSAPPRGPSRAEVLRGKSENHSSQPIESRSHLIRSSEEKPRWISLAPKHEQGQE